MPGPCDRRFVIGIRASVAAKQPLQHTQCLRKVWGRAGRLRAGLRRETRWLHELTARLLLWFRPPRYNRASPARRPQNWFHLSRLQQRISILCSSGLLRTCLLQDTIQRSGWHVNTRLARYCHRSAPVWVLKLAMTPFRPRQIPSSSFKKFDNLPDLHYLLSYRAAYRQSHQSRSDRVHQSMPIG